MKKLDVKIINFDDLGWKNLLDFKPQDRRW
jgi:hypothetical protein